MPRRLKNIRRWKKNSWQAYVQVRGRTFSKSFPLSATVEEMRAWIHEQRGLYAVAEPVRGSFAEDIAAYLTRVKAIRTIAQRTQHLEMWARELGADRPRRSITTAEIERVIQDWILAGFAPWTIRKRRMALLAMWNKLDGRDASNPVRASYTPREPKPEVRGMPYETIEKLIDAMPPSDSKIRIRVIAWTGLPPGMISQIQRDDLNLTARTLRVRPRRKGAGVEARTLPLLPQAVRALADFHEAELYGRSFSVPSLNQVFVRACRRVSPPVVGVSLYDLRHSFGAMLYRVTRDLATVSRFLLHANVAMSQRYAAGAMQDVDRAAADAMGQRLSREPVP